MEVNIGCAFCGKPITKSVRNGMTCEDNCIDKWARWERLNRKNYQKYLSSVGELEEALKERDFLQQLLFREDGNTKFS
jgi:hypothetical protein